MSARSRCDREGDGAADVLVPDGEELDIPQSYEITSTHPVGDIQHAGVLPLLTGTTIRVWFSSVWDVSNDCIQVMGRADAHGQQPAFVVYSAIGFSRRLANDDGSRSRALADSKR